MPGAKRVRTYHSGSEINGLTMFSGLKDDPDAGPSQEQDQGEDSDNTIPASPPRKKAKKSKH